jgi:hypothetical protein
MAALNLKNHVQVTVEDCLFRDNEIAFRIRGGTGELGGARVSIDRCAVYDSLVAIRAEDRPEALTVRRLGVGHGTRQILRVAGGGSAADYGHLDHYVPPPYEKLLRGNE